MTLCHIQIVKMWAVTETSYYYWFITGVHKVNIAQPIGGFTQNHYNNKLLRTY